MWKLSPVAGPNLKSEWGGKQQVPSLSTYLKRSNFTKTRMTGMVKKPNGKNEAKMQNWEIEAAEKLESYLWNSQIFSLSCLNSMFLSFNIVYLQIWPKLSRYVKSEIFLTVDKNSSHHFCRNNLEIYKIDADSTMILTNDKTGPRFKVTR